MPNLKVNGKNYVTICGWMRSEMDLKGNELLVYAIIYGFCQADNQMFEGSLQYLADWTGSTKQGIQKNLKSLLEKGYIKKEETYKNGVKFCSYYATEFNGVYNSVVQGMQLSCTNNIEDNIEDNIEKNILCNRVFEEAWKLYPEKKGKSAVSKKSIMELEDAGFDTVKSAITDYLADVKEKRDSGFNQRYMNGSTFFNGRWRDYVQEEHEQEEEQHDWLKREDLPNGNWILYYADREEEYDFCGNLLARRFKKR